MPSPSRASRHTRPANVVSDKFILLDELKSAGGFKGIITQRRSNGAITFSIVREFERDGQLDWTSYVGASQIGEFRTMLDMIDRRIRELNSDPAVAKPR